DALGVDRGDRLRGRVPEADRPLAVEQEDRVADVLEHPRRIGTLLDSAVEASAVEGEADSRGEVLDQGEIVHAVGGAARRSREGECAERLVSRAQGHGDCGGGFETIEEACGLLSRIFARRGEKTGAPAVRDRANAVSGGVRRSAAVAGRGLRTRDSQACELVPVLDHVDDAPVRKLANDEIGHPLQGRLLVECRGQLVADPAHEVEPRLALAHLGGGSTLSSGDPLAFVLGASQLAEVAQERLRVEWLTVPAAHRGGLLAHPYLAAVAREQAVVDSKWHAA